MLPLSPSRVARYFYHECDRYFCCLDRYNDDSARRGVYVPPYDHSPRPGLSFRADTSGSSR